MVHQQYFILKKIVFFEIIPLPEIAKLYLVTIY